MGTSVIVVDAFTDRPFRGNPAAVCVLDHPADDGWMQAVAREVNLSATALVHRDDTLWHLRWFSLHRELDLCGHATLATTHVLSHEHEVPGPIRYSTRSGLLAAQSFADTVVLDFPADPPAPADAPQGMLAALGVPDDTPVQRGRLDYVVLLDTAAAVRSLRPAFGLLRRVECRGVIVTATADPDDDAEVVSRFFAPSVGIDEDPVTGSAHCILGPLWFDRLGVDRVRFRQISARGGELEVARAGDRVEISGRAVVTLRGELVV
ncbi:MAG: PhzF family phenazine biosynthesis protein [Acidimicrobiales bacterium]